MKVSHRSRVWLIAVSCFLALEKVSAQVTINEFVVDERTATSGLVHPSTREFLELHNASAAPVDLSNWMLTMVQIGSNFGLPAGTTTYTIPSGSSIAAGDYFVIGHTGGTNVDFAPTPAFGGDLFPDGNTRPAPEPTTNGQFVFELRNESGTLLDAVANETFRGTERANLTDEERTFTGGGIWPQIISTNVPTGTPQFNSVSSVARYANGVRSGANGRDFGFLPQTPGTSNNLPQVGAYVVPNVDALAVETPLGASYGYYGSFKLPSVADPTSADGIVNQKAIPAPPVGTNVIMAYDNSGGGNVVASKSLVHSFDIYTYIDTDNFNLIASHPTDSLFGEQTVYGIGTTDPFFATSNSTGLLTNTSTANGSTGVGWQIQKVERDFGAGVETRTRLQLINFDDGGDSIPTDGEWQVIADFDLSDEASAWHRLGVDYNPTTHVVTGRYDEQTFMFTYGQTPGDFNGDGSVDAADYVIWRKTNVSDYATWRNNFGASGGGDLVGTFYAGYRDLLDDADGVIHYEVSRPATYVQYEPPGIGSGTTAVPEPSTIGLAMIGIFAALAGRRGKKC